MNDIELAHKLEALNEYTNNRRHELHDSDAKPDLGEEIGKALQAIGLSLRRLLLTLKPRLTTSW